jgi:carboxyl-terminal processing protease
VNKGRMVLDIALVGVLGVAAVGSTLALTRRGDDYAFFDELIDVRQILTQRYVEPVDQATMREGAIRGMVEALDDPYTVYVPAAEKRSFNKDLTGEYVGIGAQVNQQEGWLTIVSPLEDSPAFRAGLMPDDRIVEIEGVSTHNVPINECIDRLLGEPGTKVTFVVERKGERFTVEITRDRIKTRSVKGVHRSATDQNAWEYMIDPASGIAYVRLVQFTPGCAAELAAALKGAGAEAGKVKGLVLDLRFNPGGLLDEAEKIADLFLREGVIVSTRGRVYPEVVRKATDEGTLPDFPVAVLLNGQSASASEVLAGALTENNRAIAVGTRSFGKGSVQSVLELPAGSELKVTEQGYYLPSGRSISRKDDSPQWGVDPSEGFYVPMTDEQIIEMLDARRRQELLNAGEGGGAPGPDWNDAGAVLAYLKDPQLEAAVRALQARVDTGEWKPTGGSNVAITAAAGELTRLAAYRDRLLRDLARTQRRADAIERGNPQATPESRDLWDDAVDVRGGVVEVRDKDGEVIATLDITGPNLERWLMDADVKKKD